MRGRNVVGVGAASVLVGDVAGAACDGRQARLMGTTSSEKRLTCGGTTCENRARGELEEMAFQH